MYAQTTKEFVYATAQELTARDETITGPQLAYLLNEAGFKTLQGEPYKGTRGIYALIQATWRWLNDKKNLPDDAAKVAIAFKKPDGTYAYDQRN